MLDLRCCCISSVLILASCSEVPPTYQVRYRAHADGVCFFAATFSPSSAKPNCADFARELKSGFTSDCRVLRVSIGSDVASVNEFFFGKYLIQPTYIDRLGLYAEAEISFKPSRACESYYLGDQIVSHWTLEPSGMSSFSPFILGHVPDIPTDPALRRVQLAHLLVEPATAQEPTGTVTLHLTTSDHGMVSRLPHLYSQIRTLLGIEKANTVMWIARQPRFVWSDDFPPSYSVSHGSKLDSVASEEAALVCFGRGSEPTCRSLGGEISGQGGH